MPTIKIFGCKTSGKSFFYFIHALDIQFAFYKIFVSGLAISGKVTLEVADYYNMALGLTLLLSVSTGLFLSFFQERHFGFYHKLYAFVRFVFCSALLVVSAGKP